MNLRHDEPLAIEVTEAIQRGDVAAVERLLRENPGLERARIARSTGESHTLLHVVAEWPGHYPARTEIASALIAAGADVNARFEGPHHSETPLHWAASNDDVELLDALLDAARRHGANDLVDWLRSQVARSASE